MLVRLFVFLIAIIGSGNTFASVSHSEDESGPSFGVHSYNGQDQDHEQQNGSGHESDDEHGNQFEHVVYDDENGRREHEAKLKFYEDRDRHEHSYYPQNGSPAPVPLPAAFWFMMSGIPLLFARRKAKNWFSYFINMLDW